jgi:hypothetical protein
LRYPSSALRVTAKRRAGFCRLFIIMQNYFSHDYGARNDPKLIKLQIEMGQEGKGIYWDLIEIMYEQNGILKFSEIDCYSFSLKTDTDKIKRILCDFNLFTTTCDVIENESVKRRLQQRELKSIKALESINNRWKKTVIRDKIRTYYDRNTIKEVKDINKRKNIYTQDFDNFWKEYPKRKDKGHAFKAWEFEIKTTDPKIIIDGAKKYAIECNKKKTEERYIKMAQGWLSGQRWLDEESKTTPHQWKPQ